MSIKRHKMSLDVEYVKDWTVQDALREIFQNAIDTGNWRWEFKQNTLYVISKDVELTLRSLLLGHSKKPTTDAIGKFGEGYKLAMLVLRRLDFYPYILTGDTSWQPKIINSRTYGAQQLVFDIYDGQPLSKDVVFVIPNITNEIFSELMDKNLHVRPPANIGWDTSKGTILSTDYRGKVFVNGLWVCDIDTMHHGYNINAKYLQLDRDRRVIRDFDLQWLTCQMWSELNEHDYILSMIKEGAPDVKYLDSFTYRTSQTLADRAAEVFIDEHGKDAVPVVDQFDMDMAKQQGHETIILVPKVTYQLMKQSAIWVHPEPKIIRQTPREKLLDFYHQYGALLNNEANTVFNDLLEEAKSWRM